MTDYNELIALARSQDEDSYWSSRHAFRCKLADAIEKLVAERDAWKDDAADRDDIEGALEQSEKSRQDWRERAEKAEADLAAARKALLWAYEALPISCAVADVEEHNRHQAAIAAARAEGGE